MIAIAFSHLNTKGEAVCVRTHNILVWSDFYQWWCADRILSLSFQIHFFGWTCLSFSLMCVQLKHLPYLIFVFQLRESFQWLAIFFLMLKPLLYACDAHFSLSLPQNLCVCVCYIRIRLIPSRHNILCACTSIWNNNTHQQLVFRFNFRQT